jgi:hypothetical protein
MFSFLPFPGIYPAIFERATVCGGLECSGTIAEYTLYCKTDTIPFRYGGTSLTA